MGQTRSSLSSTSKPSSPSRKKRVDHNADEPSNPGTRSNSLPQSPVVRLNEIPDDDLIVVDIPIPPSHADSSSGDDDGDSSDKPNVSYNYNPWDIHISASQFLDEMEKKSNCEPPLFLYSHVLIICHI